MCAGGYDVVVYSQHIYRQMDKQDVPKNCFSFNAAVLVTIFHISFIFSVRTKYVTTVMRKLRYILQARNKHFSHANTK